MSTYHRILWIFLLAGLITPAEAIVLAPGDVIVLETTNAAVVRVRPDEYDPSDKSANQTVISDENSQGNLLSNPYDVAIGEDSLFVTDRSEDIIVRIDIATGAHSLVDVNVGGQPLSIDPRGIAIDSNGKLVVVDRQRFEVLEIDPDTGAAASLTPNVFLGGPLRLALDDEDTIYLQDGSAILKITPANQVSEQVGSDAIDGLALDSDSNVLYSAGSSEVWRYDPEAYDSQDPSANRTQVFDDDADALALASNGDLFATRSNNTDLLRINPSNGTSSIAAEGGALLIPSGVAVVAGDAASGSATSDFDADADSDVLLRQTLNGSWRRFLIGNFAVDSSAAMQVFTSSVWTHQTNADFDGDGDADILIRRNDGVWRVFEVQNGATVGSSVMSLFLNLTWEFQAATDFDGDGDADILARKSDTGAWRIFKVQDRQVVSSAGVGLFPNSLWEFQGAADYDGDGDCDVLLRRSDIGRWQIFQMQDGGLVSSAPAGALFLSSSWEYQTSGDMDKDGVADVVLRNTGSGEWRAFKIVNRVVNSVQPLNLFTNLLWEHAQTGDFDGDGDQDLLLRKSDNSFWRFFHIENRQKTGTTAPSIWQNLNFEVKDIAPAP